MSRFDLLSFEGSAGKLRGVNVFAAAAVNDENGRPTKPGLALLGAGLRQKTVLVVPAVQYMAQVFADNASAFNRTPELAAVSLLLSKRIALRLDFLRNGDLGSALAIAEDVYESARAHGFDDDAELRRLRQAFAGSADGMAGKSATVLLMRDEVISRVNFYLQDAAGAFHSFQGSDRLCLKVLCNWIGGQLTDSGALQLRAALLAKPP